MQTSQGDMTKLAVNTRLQRGYIWTCYTMPDYFALPCQLGKKKADISRPFKC